MGRFSKDLLWFLPVIVLALTAGLWGQILPKPEFHPEARGLVALSLILALWGVSLFLYNLASPLWISRVRQIASLILVGVSCQQGWSFYDASQLQLPLTSLPLIVASFISLPLVCLALEISRRPKVSEGLHV